jgi:hypothetical protein
MRDDTHATWRRLSALFRLEHDECSVDVIRPIDRNLYRNADRKDDPFASLPLRVLERSLGRTDAACLRCDTTLQGSADATGVAFIPADPDLVHLAECYFVCAACSAGLDDDAILALIGGVA